MMSCLLYFLGESALTLVPWQKLKTPKFSGLFLNIINNRVICKGRKTQHQNPEFGHTQGEIQKKTCKKVYLHSTGDETQKTINFGGKLSVILSFLFPERLHC